MEKQYLQDNFILVLAVVLIMSLIAFALMGIDKNKAKRKEYRIPEKTLFLSAILFGGVGAVLGMQVFRHKTKHWYFVVFMPVIMLLQIAGLIWIWL